MYKNIKNNKAIIIIGFFLIIAKRYIYRSYLILNIKLIIYYEKVSYVLSN